MLHIHQQHGKRTWAQVFLGRFEDPALLHALRVAGSVVLLLLLAAALTRLLVHVGLLPEWLPFSWSGVGEELLVKPAGAFVIVLFLHLLRWLIRAGRRRLALTLVAAGTGDGRVRLWNLATDQEWVLDVGPRAVTALAFAPDGRTLAVGLGNKQPVTLWNLPTAWLAP